MRILVTGGAGYVGSHVAKALARAGHLPVVLDNLSRGHKAAVKWGPLVEADLADAVGLRAVFRHYSIDTVVHMAAYAYVGESMLHPSEYFRNNFVHTQNLLDAMIEAGVRHIVFSSSCATYGEPQFLPVTEEHRQIPKSPYGESKLMVERMLAWYAAAYGLCSTSLRYFNAAGADPECEIGEDHRPETHLIPLAIAAAEGDAEGLEVYGSDYDTPDRTAVRDFVHVTDLSIAHTKAVERLAAREGHDALNLGTGTGWSVRQVIAAVEAASGRIVPVTLKPRREGDPAVLVADARKAGRELAWRPQYSSLDTIVATAHRWYCRHRPGRDAHLSGARAHAVSRL